jgi:hypothetical protein
MDLQWEYSEDDLKDFVDWKLLLELGSLSQRSKKKCLSFWEKKIGVVSCLNFFLIFGHNNSFKLDPDPDFCKTSGSGSLDSMNLDTVHNEEKPIHCRLKKFFNL